MPSITQRHNAGHSAAKGSACLDGPEPGPRMAAGLAIGYGALTGVLPPDGICPTGPCVAGGVVGGWLMPPTGSLFPLGMGPTGSFGCVVGDADGVVPVVGVVVVVPVTVVLVVPPVVVPLVVPLEPEPVAGDELDDGLDVEDGLTDPEPEPELQAAAKAITPIGRIILMFMSGLP